VASCRAVDRVQAASSTLDTSDDDAESVLFGITPGAIYVNRADIAANVAVPAALVSMDGKMDVVPNGPPYVMHWHCILFSRSRR
jgi:hypothetical protein